VESRLKQKEGYHWDTGTIPLRVWEISQPYKNRPNELTVRISRCLLLAYFDSDPR
jgi:hypothetical protein